MLSNVCFIFFLNFYFQNFKSLFHSNFLILKLNSQIDSENYDEYDQADHKKENTDEVNYDDFLKFLIIKRPVVERALNQNAQNIFFDYRKICKMPEYESSILFNIK